MLWQIEQTRLLKLPHVYLGYWIAESPKMAYKSQFRPHQLLIDGRWQSPDGALSQADSPAWLDSSRGRARRLPRPPSCCRSCTRQSGDIDDGEPNGARQGRGKRQARHADAPQADPRRPPGAAAARTPTAQPDDRPAEAAVSHHDRVEADRVEEKTTPRTPVIYETVRRAGEQEMARPAISLWWSGIAAGLSISFSLLAQASLLHARLPDAPWRDLVVALGYPFGFLIVVLAASSCSPKTRSPSCCR